MTIRKDEGRENFREPGKKEEKVRRSYPRARVEERKRYMKREVSPYNRLGSLTYAEPPLHAISTTILPRLAPFALRSTERSSFLPFALRDAPLRVRSLHNYYDYRE